jgi:UDP-N-acetylmuramate dehydrogenase
MLKMIQKHDRGPEGKGLDEDAGNWLRETFQKAVRFNEPMSRHTSFHIGGPADIWVEPENMDQLKTLVDWSMRKGIPYFVMGGGTNILVVDEGLRGVTIGMNRLTAPLEWGETQGRIHLTAAAGVPTRRLCALALRNGWQGMNFALGIPGLLGGAVSMNAGTGGGQMADVLEAVVVLTGQGDVVRLEKQTLRFEYRRMRLPENITAESPYGAVVVRAEIGLSLSQGARMRNQARETLRRRAQRQPVGDYCAGSFFKNPSKDTPAGRLIDEAGLKGVSVGDAQVSTRHANFIVNRGRASAADVLRLKALIEETVRHRFGICLQPEVRIVGQNEEK